MSRRKQKMSFRDAMDLCDDDMPDGAFFALAHEYAGLEYGEGFDELAEESQGAAGAGNPSGLKKTRVYAGTMNHPIKNPLLKTNPYQCTLCGRRYTTEKGCADHIAERHAKRFREAKIVNIHDPAAVIKL